MNIETLAKATIRSLSGAKCTGVATFTVDSTNAVSLPNIPSKVNSALIIIESDGNTIDFTKSIRLWENGQVPTSSEGYPLGNLDSYEVTGTENIYNVKFIGITPGETHTIQVMYY